MMRVGVTDTLLFTCIHDKTKNTQKPDMFTTTATLKNILVVEVSPRLLRDLPIKVLEVTLESSTGIHCRIHSSI